MKIKLSNKQELETDGILGIVPKRNNATLVKYANHSVLLLEISSTEVMSQVSEAKNKPR